MPSWACDSSNGAPSICAHYRTEHVYCTVVGLGLSRASDSIIDLNVGAGPTYKNT